MFDDWNLTPALGDLSRMREGEGERVWVEYFSILTVVEIT